MHITLLNAALILLCNDPEAAQVHYIAILLSVLIYSGCFVWTVAIWFSWSSVQVIFLSYFLQYLLFFRCAVGILFNNKEKFKSFKIKWMDLISLY